MRNLSFAKGKTEIKHVLNQNKTSKYLAKEYKFGSNI